MLQHQRQWAQLQFRALLADSTDTKFEDLFHHLMELCHPSYVPVRTHGNLGDQGCDGLGLSDRKLYACYGPETVTPTKVRQKFHSDLNKAIAKRPGQFDIFVFVHNDHRGGIHPVVATELALAQASHPDLGFEQMGPRKLWIEAARLDKLAMEQLLNVPEIPVLEVVYGIGMAEIQPLLDHLRSVMHEEIPATVSLAPPPGTKLVYNALGMDCSDAIRAGLKRSYLIDDYYADGLLSLEHDELAAGFKAHYQQVRSENSGSADDVMWEMEGYVLGNQRPRPDLLAAARVVLAHFFERCEIFDVPPDGWQPGQPHGWS
jgi:hypothetical protein